MKENTINRSRTEQEEGIVLALATAALVVGGVIIYNVRKRNSGVTDYKEAGTGVTSESLGLQHHYDLDTDGLFKTSYTTGTMASFRNHNPLNILYKAKNDWLGKVDNQGEKWEHFKANIYGYRAAFVLLQNYINSGTNTISKIVTRWCGSANATYIAFVARVSGINKDQILSADDYENLCKVVYGMTLFESGIDVSDLDTKEIEDAALLRMNKG